MVSYTRVRKKPDPANRRSNADRNQNDNARADQSSLGVFSNPDWLAHNYVHETRQGNGVESITCNF